MEKTFLNYPDWQDTADTIHLFLQVAGKVKVERCAPRPEWEHVLLYLLPDGLTTGLIPGDNSPFSVFFDFRQHQVEFRNGEGKRVDIPLEDGLSVADFYKQFNNALEQLGSPTPLCVKAQQFYEPVDLDKDEKHHTYDKIAIRKWLQSLFFAYKAMSLYLAPFHGKIHYPAYYFGRMDLSCMVFNGELVANPSGNKIVNKALDEGMYACGFWPGDISSPQAAFYALPYPFIEDLKDNTALLQPDKAIFKPDKKEFFLALEDAFSYPNPEKAVVSFFKSGFDTLQQIQPWRNLNFVSKQ
ncbi:DUF5996 family protein [uncultured Odoribacter sp.]|uniref:DUF5996 family protein n=1 Tax=uncultured Odoribacter sp. TaxID=876416 RepID=UPI002623C9BF|nr:DUF5996 family protein [uncultured Odoribacter sp.]